MQRAWDLIEREKVEKWYPKDKNYWSLQMSLRELNKYPRWITEMKKNNDLTADFKIDEGSQKQLDLTYTWIDDKKNSATKCI